MNECDGRFENRRQLLIFENVVSIIAGLSKRSGEPVVRLGEGNLSMSAVGGNADELTELDPGESQRKTPHRDSAKPRSNDETYIASNCFSSHVCSHN